MVFVKGSPYHQPNWRRYGLRAAQARRLLEQAGCRRGADGDLRLRGERLSLRFATPAGLRARGSGRSGSPGAASAGRGRGRARVRAFATFFGIFAAWRLRPRCFRPLRAAYSRARWASLAATGGQLLRVLPAARHARPRPGRRGFSTTARRARLLNRVDARLAKDVPEIPLIRYRPRRLHSDRPRRRPERRGPSPWNAENWWLAE